VNWQREVGITEIFDNFAGWRCDYLVYGIAPRPVRRSGLQAIFQDAESKKPNLAVGFF